MRTKRVERSELYCLNCGNQAVIQRSVSRLKEAGHRKKLYCWKCKADCNHIEIKNMLQYEAFMEGFKNGEYAVEAADSLAYVRNTGQREVALGSGKIGY